MKQSKILISIAGLAAFGATIAPLAVLSSCSCDNKSSIIHVKSITIDPILKLEVGNIVGPLMVKILPENATDKSVTWKSSDESVATVDQNGKVTAKAIGNTTITVTSNEGKKTSQCSVGVVDKFIHVTSVTLDKTELKLCVGSFEILKLTVLPEKATDKSVTWKSNDESVAVVDQNGKVTAKAIGTTTVTVTTKDGGFTDICAIQVVAPTNYFIDWTNKKLTGHGFNNQTLYEVAQLAATIEFSNVFSTDGVMCGVSDEDKIYASYDQTTLKIWSSGKITFTDNSRPEVLGQNFGWFAFCHNVKNIFFNNVDFSQATDMSRMFWSCSMLSTLDLSSFYTSNVISMLEMFYDCSALTLIDLSSFNTLNVNDMSSMFNACVELTTIYASDAFVVENVTKHFAMFNINKKLVGGKGTTYSANHNDKEYARIDGGSSKPGYFTQKS